MRNLLELTRNRLGLIGLTMLTLFSYCLLTLCALHHVLNLFQNWDIESLEIGNHWGMVRRKLVRRKY
jgi:hypothetical protein